MGSGQLSIHVYIHVHSIIHGCICFDPYVYGREIKVQTNHKRQVQKSDRNNSDRQSRLDQLGSTKILKIVFEQDDNPKGIFS